MCSSKTIIKRKRRKGAGKWAQHVIELRRRVLGTDDHGEPIHTQKELAETLRISSITVSRWERGEQDPPPATRARLALLAENLAIGQDLVRRFRGDRDDGLRKIDRDLVALLRCQLLARDLMDEPQRQELARLATGLASLAHVVSAANKPGNMVIDEMSRVLRAIEAQSSISVEIKLSALAREIFPKKAGTK
jgi:transcriptional regulator with XRE-family HTH domain